MMIIMVVVMDVLVFPEVHVASHTSILLFILKLLMLSETDTEMDWIMDLETDSDLEMVLETETVLDLETDSVLDMGTDSVTDLVLETDMATDLEADMATDLEAVIMDSEVVSTTMVCTVTTDGQFADLTTTEYVINVAISQVEDQDAM